jgi:hypothetical protein
MVTTRHVTSHADHVYIPGLASLTVSQLYQVTYIGVTAIYIMYGTLLWYKVITAP